MIVDAFPTLFLGDNDLWAKVVDRNKTDLSDATVTVRLIAPDGVATEWAAPRYVEDLEAAQGILRVAVSFVAAVVGMWEVQVRVAKGGTTSTVSAGFVRVVA